MKYDFSGWATKNDLLCSDGRTIRKGAFEANDGKEVPLVWNHQHDNPCNVLGHALLENRDEGVYAYCTFNDTDEAQHAKMMVQHGDIQALSIFANQLKQNGSNVMHGVIREVSLVLAGANPGAWIDSVMSHSEASEDEAVIYTDEIIDLSSGEFAHAATKEEDKEEPAEEKKEEPAEEKKEEPAEEKKEEVKEEPAEEKKEEPAEDKTIKEVLDSMNDDQKVVLYSMVNRALKEGSSKKANSEGGKEEMKHNVFANEQTQEEVLAHSEMEAAVIADAKRFGTMKESFIQHAAEYGIDNLDYIAPEFQNVNGNVPGFIKRQPDAWVDTVMSGVHHTPFAKVKMVFADLREDEARAKGYIKGKLKKEEVFALLKRTVQPTTIYKKQKMDRDDVIDITDFDVIAWLKSEMRMMLDEEIARAILFGDGRSSVSEDKISATNIIPVVADAELYTIQAEVTPAVGQALADAIIDASVKAQDTYEGSGNLTAYMAAGTVSDMRLLKDADGHRMYKDEAEIALAMGVNKIVKVPASIVPAGVYAVIVDLKDYNIGADKGGAVNMFDDFDIDYNQMKYLIETRCSGALTKPFSAIVLKAAD